MIIGVANLVGRRAVVKTAIVQDKPRSSQGHEQVRTKSKLKLDQIKTKI